MDTLWDTSCITQTTNDVDHMTSLGLKHNLNTAATDKTFYYHRGLDGVGNEKPILVLLHGYPQTSFMWRHVVLLLPNDIPLFIPDLSGYGRSSPLSVPHDKRNQGASVLSALHTITPSKKANHPLILVGHDRGARICHRLAVDETHNKNSHFKILRTCLIDIVPTLTQIQSFSIPAASVGSFHWPFLANVELATTMIKALGGGEFVKMCLERWMGKKGPGHAKFNENDALRIYMDSFNYESVIRTTCDDYRAGAEEDARLQEEDQKEGRKVDVDVLVLYSAGYLGSRYDIRKVWREWMGEGGLEVEGVDGGVGHFIAEEAPKMTADFIETLYKART